MTGISMHRVIWDWLDFSPKSQVMRRRKPLVWFHTLTLIPRGVFGNLFSNVLLLDSIAILLIARHGNYVSFGNTSWRLIVLIENSITIEFQSPLETSVICRFRSRSNIRHRAVLIFI